MNVNVEITLDPASMMEWIKQARPGSEIRYYKGFLAVDAEPHPNDNRDAAMQRRRLRALANHFYVLAERGEFTLYQRRNGKMNYSYFARRRSTK